MNSTTRKITALAVAATMALGVTACGDDDEQDTTGAAADTPAMSSESQPTVSFESPAEGSTLGDKVTARVNLDGFELNGDAVGKQPADGEGHLHFSLDGGKYDNSKYSGANGKLAEQLGVDGKYSPSVTPEITYENLPKGEHTLEVYLAENNHEDQGAKAEVTFTVE